LKDLTWYIDSGDEVTQDYLANPNNHFLAYRIDGTEFGDPSVSVYVAYNGWSGAVQTKIPVPLTGNQWYVVADTSSNAEGWGNIRPVGQEATLGHNRYLVNARSVVLLIER
jgi:glycogen operon protein